MEVKKMLHMNKGSGETSYAKNSIIQAKIISNGKPIIEEALQFMCKKLPRSMGIADLGCSSGPNTLTVISEIVDILRSTCQSLDHSLPEELNVHLNDLPGNDFNSVFGYLPGFGDNLKEKGNCSIGHCFVSGVPGSFYGRLFPRGSLHFVHSSSSLHWLSQVPEGLESKGSTSLNKGKLYISKTSHPCVLEAYSMQFQKDFWMFLKSRSEEIVAEGCMVLSFIGRRCTDPTTEESCYQWELLAQALHSMVSEGLVEEERIDSFNAPYYAPCPEELESLIQKEGSFIINRLETFEIDWDGGICDKCFIGNVKRWNNFDPKLRGEGVSKTIRAVTESMLQSHFGADIMDQLFQRYSSIVGDHLSHTRAMYINLVISLIKR